MLIALLSQHNVKNSKIVMLNIGRIFEIIITSLIGSVTTKELDTIVNRLPFFSASASAIAPNVMPSFEKGKRAQDDTEETEERRDQYNVKIAELNNEIAQWRESHQLDNILVSPWLVYKVFNKVYQQAANSGLESTSLGSAIKLASYVFYATWSAFGSFEKGELFGLPNLVATSHLDANSVKRFYSTDHYNLNLRPFFSSQEQSKDNNETDNEKTSNEKNNNLYGQYTRSVSYCLASHPLKKWLDELYEVLR